MAVQLLKELLSNDGIIFISIDDNEIHNLVAMCNEIFNAEFPLATFVWKKRSGTNDAKSMISYDQDYIVCYRKSDQFIFEGTKKDFSKYKNTDNDPEGAWAVDNLTCNKTKEERPNLFYPITDPKTNITYQANPNRVWAYEPERMKTIIAANKVIFPKSGKGTPQYKRHLKEVKSDRKPLSTWIESSTINEDSLSEEQNEYGVAIMQSVLNSQGTKTLQAIMGSQVFDYPKPVEVIKELIKQSTKDSDIVLDSFAGSGTTAHAVLNCNQEDGGNRKFILVEMEDYANDITAERVRRVIKGVPDAKDDVLKEGLGGSFTFCELGEAFDIDKILTGESLPNYNALAHYVFYTATGQSLDKEVKPAKNFLIGETDLFEIYLIYKDDLAYLRSNESALNQEKLDLIAAEKSNKQKIVFATAKYMGQSELTANKITFCQIPYAIHKIAGN